MSADEAQEFWEFNMVGAYVGDATPCFIDVLTDARPQAATMPHGGLESCQL